jgi:hypothetical protein
LKAAMGRYHGTQFPWTGWAPQPSLSSLTLVLRLLTAVSSWPSVSCGLLDCHPRCIACFEEELNEHFHSLPGFLDLPWDTLRSIFQGTTLQTIDFGMSDPMGWELGG